MQLVAYGAADVYLTGNPNLNINKIIKKMYLSTTNSSTIN